MISKHRIFFYLVSLLRYTETAEFVLVDVEHHIGSSTHFTGAVPPVKHNTTVVSAVRPPNLEKASGRDDR